MTLDDLIKSEIFVKEGSGVDFKSPREYVLPFVDKISKLTNDFNIEISNKTTNRDKDSLVDHTSYGRFKIEAKLPSSFDIADSGSVIGMIVALDTKTPTFKCYNGKNVFACTNLTIFNANHVFTQENNIGAVYSKVQDYIDTVDKGLEEYALTVNMMKQKIYSGRDLDTFTGNIIRASMRNPKLGHTVVIQGLKELEDSKSVYFARNNENSAWNYYNAVTEYIKKADILDRGNKTVALSEIFLN